MNVTHDGIAATPLRSQPVRDHMHAPVRTISESASLGAADRLLREYGISNAVVVDARAKPVGLISRTDLLRVGRSQGLFGHRHPLLRYSDAPVSTAMTRGVVSVALDTTVGDAGAELVRRKIHRVFVREGESIAGVVSTREFTAMVAERKIATPLGDFMSVPVKTVLELDPAARAVGLLEDAHVSGLVVLDEEERPTGLFTQVEALQARQLPEHTPVEQVMSYALLCLNVNTALYRAARYALESRARRVVVVDRRRVCGMVTGSDFVRAVLAHEG